MEHLQFHALALPVVQLRLASSSYVAEMGLSETCAQNLPSNKGKFNPTFYHNKWLTLDLYRPPASCLRGGPLPVGTAGPLQQNTHAVVAGLLLAASLGVRFRGLDPALLTLAPVVNPSSASHFSTAPGMAGRTGLACSSRSALPAHSTY